MANTSTVSNTYNDYRSFIRFKKDRREFLKKTQQKALTSLKEDHKQQIEDLRLEHQNESDMLEKELESIKFVKLSNKDKNKGIHNKINKNKNQLKEKNNDINSTTVIKNIDDKEDDFLNLSSNQQVFGGSYVDRNEIDAIMDNLITRE